MQVLCELSCAEDVKKACGVAPKTPLADVVFKHIGKFSDTLE